MFLPFKPCRAQLAADAFTNIGGKRIPSTTACRRLIRGGRNAGDREMDRATGRAGGDQTPKITGRWFRRCRTHARVDRAGELLRDEHVFATGAIRAALKKLRKSSRFHGLRGVSSVGRASALQAEGHRFEPDTLHSPDGRDATRPDRSSVRARFHFRMPAGRQSRGWWRTSWAAAEGARQHRAKPQMDNMCLPRRRSGLVTSLNRHSRRLAGTPSLRTRGTPSPDGHPQCSALVSAFLAAVLALTAGACDTPPTASATTSTASLTLNAAPVARVNPSVLGTAYCGQRRVRVRLPLRRIRSDDPHGPSWRMAGRRMVCGVVQRHVQRDGASGVRELHQGSTGTL